MIIGEVVLQTTQQTMHKIQIGICLIRDRILKGVDLRRMLTAEHGIYPKILSLDLKHLPTGTLETTGVAAIPQMSRRADGSLLFQHQDCLRRQTDAARCFHGSKKISIPLRRFQNKQAYIIVSWNASICGYCFSLPPTPT